MILILCFIFSPLSPTGKIQKAEALPVVVVGGNGTIQDTVSAAANTVTAGLQNAFFIKEFTLDGIANGLAKMVIKSMTQSILNWINSGFQGKPAFVTDLKQFIRDRLDQTAGEFIYNDPSLNFLCSPFQLDVKVALATSYRQNSHDNFSEAQCTLSQVTDNIEGFLNGSFRDGGWQSWFELTQNPVNTPTGARLAAESEMYARLIDEKGNTIKELDWGDGFLSFKVCADTDSAAAKKNCSITTPGRVIADQINKSLGAGQDELIAADEINEIIGALIAQLAKQALTGINGLLGLGGSSYSNNSFGANGTSSYLDALGAEGTVSDGVTNPFTAAIKIENDNITLQNTLIQKVDTVEAQLNAAVSQNGGCVNLSLPAQLASDRAKAYARIATNYTHITALNSLNATYTNTTDPQVKIDAVTQYNQMAQNGSLTGLFENTTLKLYIQYDLTDAINSFSSQINAAVNRCNRDN